MSDQHPPNTETPQWLEKLQQESWQAEILISGGSFVAIIGLLGNLFNITDLLEYATRLDKGAAAMLSLLIAFLLFFLAEGFLLHLILRGFWISLVGLNYVFPAGINREKLAFRGKFNALIKEASNVPYLIKLDKLASVVFAFTFFIMFSFGGLVLFLMSFMLLAINFPAITNIPIFVKIILQIIFVIYSLGGFILLLDFFTFGRIKRIRWFSYVYYPLHYVLSRITLSFLYRRYYYTIISNISPWIILGGLTLQMATLIISLGIPANLPIDISPRESGASEFLNLREKIVKDNSLIISVRHIPRLEKNLFEEWKTKNKTTTKKSFEELGSKEKWNQIGSLYRIYVDSAEVNNLSWMIEREVMLAYSITKLTSVVDVQNLPRGVHILEVRIRLDSQLYMVDKNDPKLDYYAKAYFIVDR